MGNAAEGGNTKPFFGLHKEKTCMKEYGRPQIVKLPSIEAILK
jgi:hypothetical protein